MKNVHFQGIPCPPPGPLSVTHSGWHFFSPCSSPPLTTNNCQLLESYTSSSSYSSSRSYDEEGTMKCPPSLKQEEEDDEDDGDDGDDEGFLALGKTMMATSLN